MWSIVTDAHSRAGLAGIRALGRGGVPVLALGARRSDAGLWSRYASRRALGPPSTEARAFPERLRALARASGPAVLFPAQEEAIDTLAAGGALPSGLVLPYPGWEAVGRLRDKRRLAALSAAAGVPSPRTLAEGEAAALRPRAASLAPCVLKAPGLSEALPQTVICRTPAEAEGAFARLPGGEQVLVQELAAGPLEAVSVVLDRAGRVSERFQQRGLRLWPRSAGASSLGVSVPPDDDLVARAAEILRQAGYWGLAQVQFLATERGPAAIDVNPRFYGSMPLALAAGVNLPLAWYRAALDQSPTGPTRYREGVTYRWLEGELNAAYKGELGRLRRRAPRPRAGAMWARDDPLASALVAGDAVIRRIDGVRKRILSAPGPR